MSECHCNTAKSSFSRFDLLIFLSNGISLFSMRKTFWTSFLCAQYRLATLLTCVNARQISALRNENKNPTMMEYDLIVNDWKSRDRVAKFLGIYTSRRLYNDWTTVLPSEKARKEATWSQFKKLMCDFYKPTENLTLKHFKFRTLTQEKGEAFIAFCNKVEKESKHCQFQCHT